MPRPPTLPTRDPPFPVAELERMLVTTPLALSSADSSAALLFVIK
jgi:hypothetical protein